MTLPDDKERTHEKPFLEHLEDLRRTVFWCAVFLAAGILIAIPPAPLILEIIKTPVQKAGLLPQEFLKVMRVTGGLSIAMRVIFWSGLLVSMPGIVFVVGSFVFPGLTQREKKSLVNASIFAGVLFVGGVCMGYFVTLPVALGVMLRINSWLGVSCEFVELADYVGFVMRLLICFGLAFELPVLVLALGSLDIVSAEQLRSKRRYVIVGILVFAMVLTPPDPLTQILMAVPMILLYEVCIWVIGVKGKRRGTAVS